MIILPEASTIGETFATPKSPYVRYLDALSEAWTEASSLRSLLDPLLETVDLHADEHPVPTAATDVGVAEILDLRYRHSDKSLGGRDGGNELEFGPKISTRQLRSWKFDASPVNTFVNLFRTCRPETHTRIVVLQNTSNNLLEGGLEKLFLCHVLGTELEIRPADINTILELGSPPQDCASGWRPALKPGFFSFVAPLFGRPSCTGAYLGNRAFGTSSPEVVVLHFHRDLSTRDDWHSGCAEGMWEPPSPSTWYQNQGNIWAKFREQNLMLVFARALRHRLKTANPLLKPSRMLSSKGSTRAGASNPSGSPESPVVSSANSCFSISSSPEDSGPCAHWLFAVLSMQTLLYTERVEHLTLRWPRLRDKGTSAQQRDLWLQARQLEKVIQSGINQTEALDSDILGLPEEHYGSALRLHKRFLEDARIKADEIKDFFESKIQLKNIEVSEMSINESRSAIAVTVLAFVFIPINLASSVFGMNVQEINSTGHDIWAFVLTALIMLLFSGFAWIVWQALRNWSMIYDAARLQHGMSWPYKKRDRVAPTVEKFRNSEFRGWRRWAAYVGLRSMKEDKRHPWRESDLETT